METGILPLSSGSKKIVLQKHGSPHTALHQNKELENVANSLFNKLLDRPEGEHLSIYEPTSLAKTKGRAFPRLQKAIEHRHCVTLIDYVKMPKTSSKQMAVSPRTTCTRRAIP